MTKYWIKNDMISNKSNLNKLITNADSNSRLCWLYMENQKYYVSDLDTKLLASLNKNKITVKLVNNSNMGVQISLKKYLYSSMVNLESKKYVFMFINELEIKNNEFVNLKILIPYPNQLTNGDNLIVHAEMNNNRTSVSQNDQISNKESESELTNLINSMTPAASLKNCTLEIVEESNKSEVDAVLNLNDAFNKNSDFEFNTNYNNFTNDKTSFLTTDNSENILKSSDLDLNPNNNDINSVSEIPNQTRSVSSIKIVSLAKLRQQQQELSNGEETTNNDLNYLNLCTRSSRCSSADYMSDSVSVASLNTTIKRKRKLLQSKVSDQFENESLNIKDDYVNMSPRSDCLLHSNNLRRLSSSSTSTSNSSSSSSLCNSTSSLNNIKSKPSIFAPKRLVNQHFQKSFSEQKKVAKTRLIHNLFSPSSKKKLKLNNLFESNTTSSFNNPKETAIKSNADKNDMNDMTNQNVFAKYKSLNLDESLKKKRGKRLFDPLSHVIDDSSLDGSDTYSSNKLNPKLVVQETLMLSKANSPYRSQSTEKTCLENTSNSNNDSIPAGQKQNHINSNINRSNTVLEMSKSSLTSKQESIMNFKFKIEPTNLQNYLKQHNIINNNYE